MPQFVFNIRGSSQPLTPHRAELSGCAAMVTEAIRYAGRMLEASPNIFVGDDEWMVDAVDASGLLLLTINISLVQAPALKRG